MFVLVEDGLVAGVLGVDGLSESSTISNGNDMLDPGVLEVELWRLAYSSSTSLVFWATCGETCLLCSAVEDTWASPWVEEGFVEGAVAASGF